MSARGDATRIAVITGVVGAVATVGLTYLVNRYAPQVQPIQITPVDPTARLGSLRSDLPPLSYAIAPNGRSRVIHPGLLENTESQSFDYVVAFVNLSKTDLQNVELSVTLKRRYPYVLSDAGANAWHADGKKVDFTSHRYSIGDGPGPLRLDSLQSGHAYILYFSFATDAIPSDRDFEVTARCPEGDFSRITPIQWSQLGLR